MGVDVPFVFGAFELKRGLQVVIVAALWMERRERRGCVRGMKNKGGEDRDNRWL
jgi:hypothetical protein